VDTCVHLFSSFLFNYVAARNPVRESDGALQAPTFGSGTMGKGPAEIKFGVF